MIELFDKVKNFILGEPEEEYEEEYNDNYGEEYENEQALVDLLRRWALVQLHLHLRRILNHSLLTELLTHHQETMVHQWIWVEVHLTRF